MAQKDWPEFDFFLLIIASMNQRLLLFYLD
jgi:hypothetical protein